MSSAAFARRVSSSSSSAYACVARQNARFSSEYSAFTASSNVAIPSSVCSSELRLRFTVTWIICSNSSLDSVPVASTSKSEKVASTWSSGVSVFCASSESASINSLVSIKPSPSGSKILSRKEKRSSSTASPDSLRSARSPS